LTFDAFVEFVGQPIQAAKQPEVILSLTPFSAECLAVLLAAAFAG
jgi:hypothetical protein